ncbi:MAG: DUF6516 family protein [Chloroflexi bacterium]|nr:DUF6516 family protein [Chloroflexota bacterium]
MNPVEYLSAVKSLLLNSPLVVRHQILREYEGLQKSYIRARLTLTDESTLEFSEYIEPEAQAQFKITDYSFQWMDKDGHQIRRWDNTPHFPKLENFPHHIHMRADDVVSGQPVDIFGVLAEIEKTIAQ